VPTMLANASAVAINNVFKCIHSSLRPRLFNDCAGRFVRLAAVSAQPGFRLRALPLDGQFKNINLSM
jgi:hypothetical protein